MGETNAFTEHSGASPSQKLPDQTLPITGGLTIPDISIRNFTWQVKVQAHLLHPHLTTHTPQSNKKKQGRALATPPLFHHLPTLLASGIFLLPGASLISARKCKAKNPARCRYHKGRIVSSELHDYSDGMPEDNSLCYLYPATAKKLLKKGFSVKDKNNKTIHFSGIIYNHIFFHKRNKARGDRANYLLLAKDTIQKGTITKEKPRPEYNESARYNYINHYTIDGKPRSCRVTVAEFFTGRREVITYHLMK